MLAALATIGFLLWIVLEVGGGHVTLFVDDIGQGVAAWCATVVCCVAVFRAPAATKTWAFIAASSFAWGAGEVVWCYYALIKNVPVPFPSVADIGFLLAVPLAVTGLLVYPMGPRRPVALAREILDGCIIAASLLFASWATLLGPLYRSHQGGLLKQIISLAYPISDVIMVSLVVILIARAGQTGRVRLKLVMLGVVAFAVSDSAFAYLTEVNSYNGTSFLDTGWVAGYLLIALGGLWAMTSPAPEASVADQSTISLVAPYVPVLVVLAVTSIELLRGRHLDPVSWFMALALAILVVGREASRLLDRADPAGRDDSTESEDESLTRRDPHVGIRTNAAVS